MMKNEQERLRKKAKDSRELSEKMVEAIEPLLKGKEPHLIFGSLAAVISYLILIYSGDMKNARDILMYISTFINNQFKTIDEMKTR